MRILIYISSMIVFGVDIASAGTTVAFGSRAGGTHLTSLSAPLDERFVFQIGAFAGGFVPSSQNTNSWLAHWRGVGEVDGQVSAASFAAYQTGALGPPFPPERRIDGFRGSAVLEHNEPPFGVGGQIYVWGYDERVTAGRREWVLITGSSWGWPSGTDLFPAVSFTVSNASLAILGEINLGPVELRTAEVQIAERVSAYDVWLAQFFSESELNDPSQIGGDFADPDSDGLPNLSEYYLGLDPIAADAGAMGVPHLVGQRIVTEYVRSPAAEGIVGEVEWSTNLKDWRTDGLASSVGALTDLGEVVTTTFLPEPPSKLFFRLSVRRER